MRSWSFYLQSIKFETTYLQHISNISPKLVKAAIISVSFAVHCHQMSYKHILLSSGIHRMPAGLLQLVASETTGL